VPRRSPACGRRRVNPVILSKKSFAKNRGARDRLVAMAATMVGACAMSLIVMSTILYRHNLNSHRQMLIATAQSQACLIEAIARHDSNAKREDGSIATDHNPQSTTLSQIVDAHRRFAGIGETGEFTLARRDGESINFILRHRHGGVGHPPPLDFASSLAEPMRRALKGMSGTLIGLDYRGETVVAAYEPVAILGLGIVAKIDIAEIRTPFIRSGMAALGFAMLVILVGVALLSRLGPPLIEKLESHSRTLEHEIEQRKQQEREAHTTNTFLDTVINMSPFSMWISDREGTIIRTNSSLRKTLNLTDEKLVGKYNVLKDMNLKAQGVTPQVLAVFEKHRSSRFSMIWRAADVDDGDIDGAPNLSIDVSMFPILDDKGQLTNVICQWVDITELKRTQAELETAHARLEKRVEERTAELTTRTNEAEQLNSAMINLLEDLQSAQVRLERTTQALKDANKEMEAFAYSVSHDLRAPLRHLTGFSELLQNNDQVNLDEKARRHLTFISESAVQMGRLIDGLLDFSRTGRKALHRKPVNLDALVKKVINGLTPDIQGRRILWDLAPLPHANADRVLLHAVLTNLFSNALKFTRPRDEAKIQMGYTQNEHETIFFIRDNGVGFDMKYVEKLFGVFQRLHSMEQFEGTGIGLANVQRIIQRHGGRTWAESVLNEGSTFYFSLPKLTNNMEKITS
jgi:PAS domain S-box-containing protein